MRCRVCACTDFHVCIEGCSWCGEQMVEFPVKLGTTTIDWDHLTSLAWITRKIPRFEWRPRQAVIA